MSWEPLFTTKGFRVFSIDYKDNDDFIRELKEQLNVITNSEGYFNYLPVIQSSGYGKTRAVCQLAKSHPLIYVCFHSKTSTGHPPATPKSNIMHQELVNMKNIDEAHTVAFSWLRSMIQVFLSSLLYDGFRAVSRALLDLRQYSYGILTDINSSVANLAPSKEDDPSAHGFEKLPHEDDDLGYSIVPFGRPLWGSLWAAKQDVDDQIRFQDIICLAKQKLLGGIVSWKYLNEVDKKIAALAVVSSVATLHVSPVSSIASALVMSHMATLVAISEDHRYHIITYPSEPVMPEAALELLSEKNVEFEILGELGNAFQSGGILDAGSQGELIVRLLFLEENDLYPIEIEQANNLVNEILQEEENA
ncbi:6042_t:CDS:2, partial [Entrophospora sp. SA101]